jgi:hypothetical protein
LNLGLNHDLALVKKSKSRIVLLFFVLTLVTLGSMYAFAASDLHPNFHIVHAAIMQICPDGSQLGVIGNCHPAAEIPALSIDQQHQPQQQQQQQQQHQPICLDGSRPGLSHSSLNCPNSAVQTVSHAHTHIR